MGTNNIHLLLEDRKRCNKRMEHTVITMKCPSINVFRFLNNNVCGRVVDDF